MAEEQVRSREIDYQTAFRRQCRKGNNCGQDVEEGERREAGEKMERRSLTAFGIMHTNPILSVPVTSSCLPSYSICHPALGLL